MGKTLDPLDWLVIPVYIFGLGAIAVYHWRKLKRQDDVFLAGRSMSHWPVAISMFMALFSTNTFIGTIGWMNRPKGTFWYITQIIGSICAVPLAVSLFPALFYRLRISTAYEYLERRFSYTVRAFASLSFMAARIMWMSTMLYAASLVISVMFGWTPERGVQSGQVWSILLVGALGTFFALSGGMHAVIWTDVAQFFGVVGSVSTMVVLAVADSGGVSRVISVAMEAGKFKPPALFSLTDDLSILSIFLFGFMVYLCNTGSDQLVLQTYLSAKSEREIKSSLWRNGFILKPFSVVFSVLGILTFVYYRLHPQFAALLRSPDDALPVFVVNVLPAGLRGLMIAAIISALLTSLEGGIASLSAALQVDFIRRGMKRSLSERNAVLMGRLLILLWGSVVVSSALWVSTLGANNSIVQILNIVVYPFLGVLLGIFLLGILTSRANSKGILIGATVGFVAAVAAPLSSMVLEPLVVKVTSPSSNLVRSIGYIGSISTFFCGLFGVLATMIAGYLASLLFSPPLPGQIRGLTRRDMPVSLEVPSVVVTGPGGR
jgi:SSS family transporter